MTLRPFVPGSSVLYRWNPWLRADKMAISDLLAGRENFLLCRILSKTYFCELVPGFSPDRNQTSLGHFSGLSRSIVFEKKVEFLHLVGYNRVIWKMGGAKYSRKPINPKQKLRTSRKSLSICVMTW